jgi:hypothetical protein
VEVKKYTEKYSTFDGDFIIAESENGEWFKVEDI